MAEHVNENFAYLLNRLVPIGAIIAWHKSFIQKTELPNEWVECNGQTLDDPDSIFNGKTIPDLNYSGRFLRGGESSGYTQNDELKSHNHTASSKSAGGHSHTGNTSSTGNHSHTGSTNSAGNHNHSATTSTAGSHIHGGETYAGKGGVYKIASQAGSQTDAQVMVGYSGATTDWISDERYSMRAHRHSFEMQYAGSHNHSVTTNSTGTHQHSVSTTLAGDHLHSLATNTTGGHLHDITVDEKGGTETRPVNMSVVWIMRIK
jgi:ABC-type nickel/cobalt efflux system permease component RcnA